MNKEDVQNNMIIIINRVATALTIAGVCWLATISVSSYQMASKNVLDITDMKIDIKENQDTKLKCLVMNSQMANLKDDIDEMKADIKFIAQSLGKE